jgi:nucleotide-binding universal stress UspA family protein
MKTILVPTDFSTTAQAAVNVAINIARKAGAELILLHVLEEIEEGSFNVEGEASGSTPTEYSLFTLKLIQKTRSQLETLVSETRRQGLKVRGKLRLGNSFHGIHVTIAEQNVDLVVMGTKGSSGYEEVMVGSNAEKVVRRCSCPVLSVHERPVNADFKSIVFATSLKEEELPFSRVVKKTQELYNCPVHIVRVNTPGMFINDHTVTEKMESFVKQAEFKNYTLNVYNDFTEEEGIIRFAEKVNADMIAMATHGRRGLAHLLESSIAEDVVNHSRRPVLTAVIAKRKRVS